MGIKIETNILGWIFMSKEKQPLSKRKMDNPENSMTDKEHMLDKFEDEQHVDTIPIEDLREENLEEKNKTATKNTSSSEKKYEPEKQ